jgi:hypothetical protein
MNEQREYNVPMFVKIVDSRGNICQCAGLDRGIAGIAKCDLRKTESGVLYPGDRIEIEVEVDPTFDRSSYRLKWRWRGAQRITDAMGDHLRLVLTIEDCNVAERFWVACTLISDKTWHRFGGLDDRIELMYKVLPPRT